MTTTLLRISTPLASWGDRQRSTDHRPSSPDPTMSALQGLLAAALGVPRNHIGNPDHSPAAALVVDPDITVRVDRPGSPLTDYQTINPIVADQYANINKGTAKAAASTVRKHTGGPHTATMQTYRQYRTDAEYIVAVNDPDSIIAKAAVSPVWQLYAGRRACVLTAPFLIGQTDQPAHQALQTFPTPWLPADKTATSRTVTLITFGSAPHGVTPMGNDRRHDRLASIRPRRWTNQPRTYWQATIPLAGNSHNRADWVSIATDLTVKAP